MPDDERDMDRARDRQRDRTEHVENILDEVETDVRDRKYPIGSEELATEYADRPLDMPNETESMGSVFDRLDDQYKPQKKSARHSTARPANRTSTTQSET